MMWKVSNVVSRILLGVLIGLLIGYVVVRIPISPAVSKPSLDSEMEVINHFTGQNFNFSSLQGPGNAAHPTQTHLQGTGDVRKLQAVQTPTVSQTAAGSYHDDSLVTIGNHSESTTASLNRHLRRLDVPQGVSLSAKFEEERNKASINSSVVEKPVRVKRKSALQVLDSNRPMQNFTIRVPNIKHHGPHPSNLSQDLHLFYYAVRNLENATDLVYINGPRGKRMFDLHNTNPHLLLTDKMNIKTWKQLAMLLNDTVAHSIPRTAAVHVHNEMKIGDVLLILMREYCKKNRMPFPKPPEAVHIDRELLQRMMDYYQPPMVITNTVDENWGFLSTFIGTRTAKWLNMTNHLRIHYSNYHTFRNFLDSDKVLLILCNSHVDPNFGYHEKILPIPLGIKSRLYDLPRAQLLLSIGVKKTRVLCINNSGWGDRTKINEMVSNAFNNTVFNTYNKKNRNPMAIVGQNGEKTFEDHLLEIAQSKFVLCPSGLGFDTYRMWETIMLGSIPIIESNVGMDRTVATLPVLIIKDFKYLTPALLERAYPCFVKHAADFNFAALREDYWINLIHIAVMTGSTKHVMDKHPFRHKYCDFLDDHPPPQ